MPQSSREQEEEDEEEEIDNEAQQQQQPHDDDDDDDDDPSASLFAITEAQLVDVEHERIMSLEIERWRQEKNAIPVAAIDETGEARRFFIKKWVAWPCSSSLLAWY